MLYSSAYENPFQIEMAQSESNILETNAYGIIPAAGNFSEDGSNIWATPYTGSDFQG